jgi:hypothetical protein
MFVAIVLALVGVSLAAFFLSPAAKTLRWSKFWLTLLIIVAGTIVFLAAVAVLMPGQKWHWD